MIITRRDRIKEAGTIQTRKKVGGRAKRKEKIKPYRPALAPLTVAPRANRQLQNKHLAGLGEQNQDLGTDHVHVFVALHDALDPGQGEVDVVFEVLFKVKRRRERRRGGGREGGRVSGALLLYRPVTHRSTRICA